MHGTDQLQLCCTKTLFVINYRSTKCIYMYKHNICINKFNWNNLRYIKFYIFWNTYFIIVILQNTLTTKYKTKKMGDTWDNLQWLWFTMHEHNSWVWYVWTYSTVYCALNSVTKICILLSVRSNIFNTYSHSNKRPSLELFKSRHKDHFCTVRVLE